MVICKLKKCLSTFMIMVSLSNSFGAQLTWGSEKFDDEKSTYVTYASTKSVDHENSAQSSWGFLGCFRSAWNWCKGYASHVDEDDSNSMPTASMNDEMSEEGSSTTHHQNNNQNTSISSLSWENWYFSKVNTFWKKSEGWYNHAGTGLGFISVFLKGLSSVGELSDNAKYYINMSAAICDGLCLFCHGMENHSKARNAEPYVIKQTIRLGSTSEAETLTLSTKCFECCGCFMRISDGWVDFIGATTAAAAGASTLLETSNYLSSSVKHIFKYIAVACSGVNCVCHFWGSYWKVVKKACGNCYNSLMKPDENDNK